MVMDRILIADGAKVLEDFNKKLGEYKDAVRETKRGYIYAPRSWMTKDGLRTRHYWYHHIYKKRKNKEGKVERYRTQEYVGSEKPEFKPPKPPENPLESVDFEVAGGNILMDSKTYRKHKTLFKGFKTFTVK